MDQEIKAKWVVALRGGKYQQARYQLRHDNRYCCLGVLCDVQGLSQSNPLWQEAYPLPNLRGDMSFQDMMKLSYMNDHHDSKSFSEIADWIEENL